MLASAQRVIGSVGDIAPGENLFAVLLDVVRSCTLEHAFDPPTGVMRLPDFTGALGARR
mgnify:CR=1 FL=1